jgi:ferrochelatase
VASTAPQGVLLAQLGTPEAPTAPALRRYLRQFLGDRRVVDVNPWLWKPLLHGVILRTRPRRSAAAYARIWTPEGSPLLVHSRAQARGVAERLGAGVRVELGMRLGEPSLAGALDRLVAAGCRRIVVLPLFPQHSGATTGSVFDGLGEWSRTKRGLPEIVFVRSFADHPAWIRAWAASIRRADALPTPARPLVLSYHGIPVRHVRDGDPYADECAATTRALTAELALDPALVRVVYQSRFGREPWLEPYAAEVVPRWAREGVKSLAIVPASFVADCLETLDELGHELSHAFRAAGGQELRVVPCPNASPEALEALTQIARERLEGSGEPATRSA